MSYKELAKNLIDQIPDSKMYYIVAYLQGAAVPEEMPNVETIEAMADPFLCNCSYLLCLSYKLLTRIFSIFLTCTLIYVLKTTLTWISLNLNALIRNIIPKRQLTIKESTNRNVSISVLLILNPR